MNTYLSWPLPPILVLYFHDHPDRPSVDAVLTGLFQGFKIGSQGPRVSKEYPNLISAKQNPHIISTNLLKELQLGHTASPFFSPPFPNFQVYPFMVVPKKHSTEWRTIFHLSFPKHRYCHLYHSEHRSRVLYVQVGYQVSLLQYPSTPIRLGTPRYEMERPVFLRYSALLWIAVGTLSFLPIFLHD